MAKRIDNKFVNFQKKIVFKNANEPVQIFCPQKYRGYYIRGQVVEFSDNVYSDEFPEGYVHVFYRSIQFVLISNSYAARLLNLGADGDVFGNFIYRTMRECQKAREAENECFVDSCIENHQKRLIKERNGLKEDKAVLYLENIRKKMLTKLKVLQNKLIEINPEDVGICKSPYFDKAIKQKSDIILIKRLVFFDRAELPSDHTLLDYPQHIYHLPAYHLSESAEYYDPEVDIAITLAPGTFASDEHTFVLASKNEYLSDFSKVGDVSWEWVKSKTISKEGLQNLNALYQKLNDKADPYKEYYLSFLDDLISDLKENKIIGQCSLCGDFFRFVPKKNHCSIKSEGKDCGKKARNHRYYQRNKSEIKPKARTKTRALRAYYKEHGVKK